MARQPALPRKLDNLSLDFDQVGRTLLSGLEAERPSIAADGSGLGCPRSLNHRTTE